MFFPVLWLVAHPVQAPIEIREGLAIGGVTAPGRVPIALDSVIAKMVGADAWTPRAGDSLDRPRGGTSLWKGISANADGVFTGEALAGGGYVYATVESDTDKPMLLEAVGDSLVYVNGALRTGDPYGYGNLRIPVMLRKGTNEFLFAVGRGQLKARLLPPSAPVQLDVADATLPDRIPSDKGKLFGAIIVTNATTAEVTNLSITCSGGGKTLTTSVPRIPAMSVRKVRFDFPVDAVGRPAKEPVPLDIVLHQDGKPIHSARVGVRSREAGQTYKRTFVSDIDGSVQYYAVNPSSTPSAKNALILSVHGASVEAIGQADAYTPKPWATLVAATNRRPFGFDWEDWGRLDALEVLSHAEAVFPHDPKRVVLTGHSMGGHGTWSLGSLFPDRFGAVAPSAGWISFWTYGGGWEPRDATGPEAMLRRAMSPSDTLARTSNLAAQSIYILHGDADDNVPVTEARAMSRNLTAAGIPFGYHEEKGASHWWGNECVDYPDLMSVLQSARISDFAPVDFVTPDPSISGSCGWISIRQQVRPRLMSRVKGTPDRLSTENVRALTLGRATPRLQLDGQVFEKVEKGATFVRTGILWRKEALSATARQAGFSGPLKEAFRDRFVLVYGTSGTPDENRWSRNKARYDAETFYYRGNGSPEVVSDGEFLQNGYKGRNAILYGNATTNLAWAKLLKGSPIKVERGSIVAGDRTIPGEGNAVAFIYPSGSRLVAGIGGPGLAGMRLTDRLPIFTSGTAYPDWTIIGADAAQQGTKGVIGAGFFGANWELSPVESAWLNP